MRLLDVLHADSIQLNLQAKTKEEAVKELIDLVAQAGRLADREAAFTGVQAREASISTGIGEGVAVPHSKTDAVKETLVAVGLSHTGIDWQSPDGRPAHLVFLILSPHQDSGAQLRLLASIARLIKLKGVAPILLNAESPEMLLGFFHEMEGKKVL